MSNAREETIRPYTLCQLSTNSYLSENCIKYSSASFIPSFPKSVSVYSSLRPNSWLKLIFSTGCPSINWDLTLSVLPQANLIIFNHSRWRESIQLGPILFTAATYAPSSGSEFENSSKAYSHRQATVPPSLQNSSAHKYHWTKLEIKFPATVQDRCRTTLSSRKVYATYDRPNRPNSRKECSGVNAKEMCWSICGYSFSSTGESIDGWLLLFMLVLDRIFSFSSLCRPTIRGIDYFLFLF